MRLVLAEWREVVTLQSVRRFRELYTGADLESTGQRSGTFWARKFITGLRPCKVDEAGRKFGLESSLWGFTPDGSQFFVYTGPALRDGGSETARI